MSTRVSHNVPPGSAGSKPADPRDGDAPVGDWSSVRDLVQSRLAMLDGPVLSRIPPAGARPGSNRGGSAHLFVYRVYDAGPGGAEIDPVVVGITIGPVPGATSDCFRVRGDIAGESLGDVPFELPPQDVTGWEAMIDAARDMAERLADQAERVRAALCDDSRRA